MVLQASGLGGVHSNASTTLYQAECAESASARVHALTVAFNQHHAQATAEFRRQVR